MFQHVLLGHIKFTPNSAQVLLSNCISNIIHQLLQRIVHPASPVLEHLVVFPLRLTDCRFGDGSLDDGPGLHKVVFADLLLLGCNLCLTHALCLGGLDIRWGNLVLFCIFFCLVSLFLLLRLLLSFVEDNGWYTQKLGILLEGHLDISKHTSLLYANAIV